MSSISGFNFNRELMNILLERLREGMLDLDGARQLKPLLAQALKESTHTSDEELKSYLRGMINIIEMYLSGEINLLEPLEVQNVSNTD